MYDFVAKGLNYLDKCHRSVGEMFQPRVRPNRRSSQSNSLLQRSKHSAQSSNTTGLSFSGKLFDRRTTNFNFASFFIKTKLFHYLLSQLIGIPFVLAFSHFDRTWENEIERNNFFVSKKINIYWRQIFLQHFCPVHKMSQVINPIKR